MARFDNGFIGCQRGSDARRRADLAKIHILAKQAGLDQDLYRDMLRGQFHVDSAGLLDAQGRSRLLVYLRRAAGARPVHRPGAPRTIDERPMLGKIEALLADAGRPWIYAEAIARKICHVERLEFCSDADLRAVIAALVTDARRHPRREAVDG